MSAADITILLEAVHRGDEQAQSKLFAITYPQLRKIAAARIGRSSNGSTVEPTALISEAVLRILQADSLARTKNRASFFSLVARAMRSVIVDHARKRNSLKRKHERAFHCAIDEIAFKLEAHHGVSVLELEEALRMLHKLKARQHDVVVLRFFGGMSFSEIAKSLGVSVSSVEKDWYFARAWLRKTINRE